MTDRSSTANAHRSSSGCWTCRLRRKKCDETHPVCDECAFLQISCTYSLEKPEWMDGGVQQNAMAEEIKHQVKRRAPFRLRGERGLTAVPVNLPGTTSTLKGQDIMTTLEDVPGQRSVIPSPGTSSTVCEQVRQIRPFSRSDSVLFMFHLDHVLPFLFPFYDPSLLQGGKAWLLDLVISSPVFRQAVLCQSSYFFALAHATAEHDRIWETMLSQTRDAFQVLRKAVEVVESNDMIEHMRGASRTMAAVMQLQRFEIAVMCFDNCQAHLNAALAILIQILRTAGPPEAIAPAIRFRDAESMLGPPLWISTTQQTEVLSTEQSAFRFSSSLLIFDDIIASTIMRERPQLYDYHQDLLCATGDAAVDPPIKLENTIGCQNWTAVQIAEIAVLNAWKQNCMRAGALDVMELVRRATGIKGILEADLVRLEHEPVPELPKSSFVQSEVFSTLDCNRQTSSTAARCSVVRLIWTRAALLYLSLVVSGWQPSSLDVTHHVNAALKLMMHHLSPLSLLRTIVWPFCVIGCLAEPENQTHFRNMVNTLQPSSIYGPVRKALYIMERVWGDRVAGNTRDFSTYFRNQDDLVLLV